MPMPTNQASTRILVRAKSGDRLQNIKVSTAILRGHTIRRKRITLRPDTIFFRVTMPVGDHLIFVQTPGYYEAVRRVRFLPGADPLVQIILESKHQAEFPTFAQLPQPIKGIFGRSADTLGVSPKNKLFLTLPQIKNAAALNILAKMGDTEVGDPPRPVLSYVHHVYDFYQDRIYVALKPKAALLKRINPSLQQGGTRFTVAASALHKGFQDASFKTEEKSGKGNLQLSFNARDTDHLEIDADIDIYTNVLRHLFGEVFKNHLTDVKTDPYRVYQILTEAGIRPEYRLLAADEETA